MQHQITITKTYSAKQTIGVVATVNGKTSATLIGKGLTIKEIAKKLATAWNVRLGGGCQITVTIQDNSPEGQKIRKAIAAIEKVGGKRWEHPTTKEVRYYFNLRDFAGIETSYSSRGLLKYIVLDGETLSLSRSRRALEELETAKVFATVDAQGLVRMNKSGIEDYADAAYTTICQTLSAELTK